jgi:NAD(P)-dependent dehydrogenase (short-subunit alcohol dehydrogenase family)
VNLFDLSGETAVVIGATGALGGGMAEALAAAGARVAVVGRNEARAQSCVETIAKAGGTAAAFLADATDAEALRRVEKDVTSAFTAPTILVNAAGGNDPKVTVTPEHSFEDINLEDWRQHFDLNLVGGAVLPCQILGPGMVTRRKGSIINIASVSAHLPLSRVVAYSSSKAAVLSLTKFLAREWAPFGVRVNSLTPGFFPAEQNRKLLFKQDGSPTPRAQAILGHTPMGRFGHAHELSGALLLLASFKAGSFITGADLQVDGGFLSQTI